MGAAAACLFLSGAATLIYQVAWVRLLGLSMGATSASVSTVLAAFFLGLAGGGALAGRLLRWGGNPWRIYLALEAVVGLSGLLLLPILLRLDHVMALLPAVGAQQWFKLGFCLVVLGVPTACMGATWPVLAAAVVRRASQVGLRFSQLYAANTAGAMTGAASSGFLLIPTVGVDGTVVVAAVLNFVIVAAVAAALGRGRMEAARVAGPAAEAGGAGAMVARWRRQALIVLMTTGWVSIAAEVGWTKIVSVITGATIYGFSTILVAFLFGIALGAWSVRSRLERIRRPEIWMVGGLLALGFALHLTRSGLSAVPAIQMQARAVAASPLAELWIKGGLSFLLVLVPTFILGALFPLSLKLYCPTPERVGARVGVAAAVNTVAGVLGSLSAGLWIIPAVGTDGLLAALATATIVVAALLVCSLELPARARAAAAAGAAGLAALAWRLPPLDYARLIDSVEYRFGAYDTNAGAPRYLFIREGRAGLISLVTWDDRVVFLQNDGIKEGWIDRERQRGPRIEFLLGLVPYAFNPEARSAFVVGFGAGATVEALAATGLEEIRVAELEPLVVQAMRTVRPDAQTLFADSRLQIIYNDARNALLVEQRPYDIIVSQPSHPWRSGAGNLFTREFFAIVFSRLNPHGVAGFWLNLFNIDATAVKSILRAFHETFPHGFSLAQAATGDLLLFGSGQPLQFDPTRAAAVAAMPRVREILRAAELSELRDFLGLFALSGRQALDLSSDVAANTDTAILSETRLAVLDPDVASDEHPYRLLAERADFDIAPYVSQPEAADLTLALALQLLGTGRRDRAARIARHLEEFAPDHLARFQTALAASAAAP
jgi:spermidine synthase